MLRLPNPSSSLLCLVCLVAVNILLREQQAQQIGPQYFLPSVGTTEHMKRKNLCILFILIINKQEQISLTILLFTIPHGLLVLDMFERHYTYKQNKLLPLCFPQLERLG